MPLPIRSWTMEVMLCAQYGVLTGGREVWSSRLPWEKEIGGSNPPRLTDYLLILSVSNIEGAVT